MERKQRQDKTLQWASKTNENYLRLLSADSEKRIKLILPHALTEKRTEPQTTKGYKGRPSWGVDCLQLLETFRTLGQAKKVVLYHDLR